MMKRSEIFRKVEELEAKKQTFVEFINVTSFLMVCEAVGLVTFGGAFSDDMTGQYFYI